MDLELIESGSGGDLLKKLKDVSVINGIQNMPYLALFGGNIEASTTLSRPENEQAFDWWGNSLFLSNTPDQQFNSLTEKTLHEVALNSEGRQKIEDAVKSDLEFMKSFSIIEEVSVSIESTDRLLISIKIKQPENIDNKTFLFIWDATLNELTAE